MSGIVQNISWGQIWTFPFHEAIASWNGIVNIWPNDILLLSHEFMQLIFVLYHDITCVCFRQRGFEPATLWMVLCPYVSFCWHSHHNDEYHFALAQFWCNYSGMLSNKLHFLLACCGYTTRDLPLSGGVQPFHCVVVVLRVCHDPSPSCAMAVVCWQYRDPVMDEKIMKTFQIWNLLPHKKKHCITSWAYPGSGWSLPMRQGHCQCGRGPI